MADVEAFAALFQLVGITSVSASCEPYRKSRDWREYLGAGVAGNS